jgi:hypothetical protein
MNVPAQEQASLNLGNHPACVGTQYNIVVTQAIHPFNEIIQNAVASGVRDVVITLNFGASGKTTVTKMIFSFRTSAQYAFIAGTFNNTGVPTVTFRNVPDTEGGTVNLTYS